MSVSPKRILQKMLKNKKALNMMIVDMLRKQKWKGSKGRKEEGKGKEELTQRLTHTQCEPLAELSIPQRQSMARTEWLLEGQATEQSWD